MKHQSQIPFIIFGSSRSFGGTRKVVDLPVKNKRVSTNNGGTYFMSTTLCTTPSYSPQSNGMAEAFVKTFKRDYVRLAELPDALSVMSKLEAWFEDYNENAPHKGLNMKSPRQYRKEILKAG